MFTEIPLGDGAIDRVRERMQPHIGIGMPLEGRAVRNVNTAETGALSTAERMHIEPLADTEFPVGKECTPGRHQILRRSQLEIGRIAGNAGDGDSRLRRNGCVVKAAFSLPCLVCGQNRRETESLRSLRPAKGVAIHGMPAHSSWVDRPDSVGNPDRGNDAVMP